jgi:hypothetical protein
MATLGRAAGPAARDLTLGFATIRFEGLTAIAAELLDHRWGGFSSPPGPTDPDLTAWAVDGDGATWLPPWAPGEAYRIEADAAGGALVVASYHFALVPEGPAGWRLAVTDTGAEPMGRVYDNVARYLVARLAIARGGLALHGAGVRRGRRAWIFAGPSGSGKSTAARLSAPAESLGDDFAVVLPNGPKWSTCALPFDNAERAPGDPARGMFEVVRVCRLFKSEQHRVEEPPGVIAQASLLACTAFPWAFPDVADRAGEAIARLAASGRFVHLHFARDAEFWRLLEGNG